MLNILHLINYTGGGGTESYIYSLAEKLHNNNCIFLVCYSEEGPSLKLFRELGIQTIQLPMSSPYDLKAAKKLAKICKEKSIDVVHTHFLRENYISILSKVFGNKSLLINTRHMLIQNSSPIIYANKFMTRFNHKIIAVSKAVQDLLLKESINPNKIQLIYTGIEESSWVNNNNNNNLFRTEFNIDDDTTLISSVARFSEEKGHFFLLKSISLFKKLLKINNKQNMNFKFILVGDGVLLERSKKLANDLGVFEDIIFTGYRNDISNILNSSNLFVSHSESESFGISILEAMACGLPIITTDSGGTKEIIDSSGEYGILVDYGNENEFAQALFKLVNDKDLVETYKKNGFVLLNQKFSLDKTADETYNLYSYNLNES